MALVVNAGYENSLDKIGCRKAGKEIIRNLPKNYFSENNKEIIKEDILVNHINLDQKDEEDGGKEIYEKSLEYFDKHEKVIFLGGDHSLSYFTVKAFLDYCVKIKEQGFLIVFDAHADCKDNLNGTFSKLNNVNWLKNLIIDDFPSDHIVLVGLREMEKGESDFLSNHGIRYYKMKDLIDYTEICDIIMELANKYMIYISIDIDVVDASFVSGTARPEIGGMTSRQLLYFMQRLNIIKTVKGIDICEINPDLDFKENTVKLGAKILGEII